MGFCVLCLYERLVSIDFILRLRFVVYHVYFFFIQRDTDPTCPVIFACVELMLDLLNRLGAENMLSSLQSCVSGVGLHGPYSLITMLLEVV